MRKLIPVILIFVSSILILSQTGCTGSEQEALRIGLMPAVDTAPIYLALESGYFSGEGIDVEIILFNNAQDRQSALQTGRIDGAMTDLVAVAVNRAAGFPVKATTLTDGMFPLLAVPGAKDKSSLKVAMMEVSVSNYLVDQWLSDNHDIEKVYINAIPARLEAVVSHGVDMGLFPEPVATVGESRGLEKLVFDAPYGFTPDVMVFTDAARSGKSRQIEAFHRAFNRAVADIRTDGRLAGKVLADNISNISPELADLMLLPEYHEARLPDEEYLQSIIDWTNRVVASDLNISPADLVDRRFIR